MKDHKTEKKEEKCCCDNIKHVEIDKNNEKKCCNGSHSEHGEKCSCHDHGREHKEGHCCEDHAHSHAHAHEAHGSCGCGCGHEHSEKVDRGTWLAYGVGACLLIVAFLGELAVISNWIGIPAAILVYAFFGKDVWENAIRGMARKKIFTEFTLMCVATLGAAALLEFADAAAVMYLYSLGELIQGIASRKSKANISDLIEITEEYINKVENGSIKRISASSAKVGDVINVTVGERISLDGTVVDGNGFADTSAVTGESAPLELTRGTQCLSGSVLVAGAISLRVTEAYENSTANKLKKAMALAAKRKAPKEKKIARFAEIFTPCAFAFAALLFVLGWIGWGDMGRALKTALMTLVVSCPCSLVLSVPLAYFAGMGRAAAKGIVFRGGRVIDNAASLGTLIFDKTGTLTSSALAFEGVWISDSAPCTKAQLLDVSRCALEKSPHAAAQSFCNIYHAKRSYGVRSVENIGGRGLVCEVDGVRAAFGNLAMMREMGVEAKDFGKTAIYVALGDELCGALLFRSGLKPEVLAEVARVRRNGIDRIAIMSGDTNASVRGTAETVGITEYYGELKPDEKLLALENIYREEKKKNKRRTVGFCGDGLNDLAAIARADVGIAMGSGSAISVESADAVIVDDSIARVNDMIDVAQSTVSIVNQNIALSIGIKLLVILAGLLGLYSLELAIIADVGAAVVTVLNALRAGKIK